MTQADVQSYGLDSPEKRLPRGCSLLYVMEFDESSDRGSTYQEGISQRWGPLE